jgi:hypothetical protein
MHDVIAAARAEKTAWRAAEILQTEVARLYSYDNDTSLQSRWRDFKRGCPYPDTSVNHHLKMIHAGASGAVIGSGQCPQFADVLQGACDLAGLNTMLAKGIWICGRRITLNDPHAQVVVFLLDEDGYPCMRPLCSLTADGYLFGMAEEGAEQQSSVANLTGRFGSSSKSQDSLR